ncbi:hypothetical protein D3C87_1966350 [compost metagenome]
MPSTQAERGFKFDFNHAAHNLMLHRAEHYLLTKVLGCAQRLFLVAQDIDPWNIVNCHWFLF